MLPKLTLLTLCLQLAACGDAPPPRRLVIHAGALFDGTQVRGASRVTLAHGVIVAIEPDDLDPTATPPVAADTQIVDARELTLLPGLIDAHVHIGGSGSCTPGVGVGAGQIARNLHGLLAGGVTTAADMASPPKLVVAIRDYSGVARSRGPRLLVAGAMLNQPDGYLTGLAGDLVGAGVLRPVASAKEGRVAVRDHFDAGVDYIKVGLQETNFNGVALPKLPVETLCAIVAEAHRLKLRVYAHATEAATYEAALSCGVDALVHGPYEPLPAALLARLADSAVVVAPTLFVFDAPLWGPGHGEYLRRPAAQRVLSDDVRADLAAYAAADAPQGETLPPFFMAGIRRSDAHAALEGLRSQVPRLRDAGVVLALGTDSPNCFQYAGSPVEELRRLVEAGLSPLEALHAATVGSAQLLALQDALGRVAVGYRADLIAVSGRPDRDIAAISEVRRVWIDGVEQSLTPPGLGDTAALTLGILWAMIAR